MSRSSTLSRYPAEFLTLAAECEKPTFREIAIPCDSEQEASSLRFKLYGFLKAMKLEGMDKDYPVLFAAKFRILGKTLLIEHRECTREADLVSRALSNQ